MSTGIVKWFRYCVVNKTKNTKKKWHKQKFRRCLTKFRCLSMQTKQMTLHQQQILQNHIALIVDEKRNRLFYFVHSKQRTHTNTIDTIETKNYDEHPFRMNTHMNIDKTPLPFVRVYSIHLDCVVSFAIVDDELMRIYLFIVCYTRTRLAPKKKPPPPPPHKHKTLLSKLHLKSSNNNKIWETQLKQKRRSSATTVKHLKKKTNNIQVMLWEFPYYYTTIDDVSSFYCICCFNQRCKMATLLCHKHFAPLRRKKN